MIDTNLPSLHQTGRCDCGAITVAIDGRVVSMFHCACDNCQRTSGSGHSSVVLFHRDAIRVTGATKPFSRPAASGATFTRHFCPECGTTAWAQSSRAPGLCIVPVGILAGDNAWFQPNQVIFSRSRQTWDLVEDHLPHHQTYRQEQP